ncbi:SAG family member [Eimeria tenella]|uniref:SAG family member n=1 Tax=Eimeria tenella TaxID=5802 RepID=U6KUM5_EIMTE|nr:LOW QUALITY PROTEIN: SAG family member [Eimeria tenella]CDJ40618.1 SAG family member [Eimeria tenella]|eukprot:XP_013231368.1 LOW QUALITY PROTEIN: SAG family member [Eimeria tenella]
MVRLSFVFLSASLLLLCDNNSAVAGQNTVTYTAKLGGTVQCLREVNAARELGHFTEATTDEKKISDPGEGELAESKWKDLCEYLIPTPSETYGAQKAVDPFKDGTYAFKSLTAEQPNCTETIDYWKAAYKSFTGLPPAKGEAGTLYDNQDNISFVALYNPSSSATADCRVVTCTQKASPAALSAGVSSGGNDANTKLGHAMLCKTTPTAFENDSTAPFTQEQWDKIKYSLTGSASIAAPSLVALAIVAFGITAV